jgi:ubiquinone/menaquinone biosynthesis C-methylase UbiE
MGVGTGVPMSKADLKEAEAFWNAVATDWDIQVGSEGDSNRILNSDPVLWKFAGDVSGLKVLDAGCGTGYLSSKLRAKGANVIGIDFSREMIEISRQNNPEIDFRVESCSDLKSIDDMTIDIVIANYVLMDTPDLMGTMREFNRVLQSGGLAVVIFSHPCFPQSGTAHLPDGSGFQYNWTFPYFEHTKRIDPPWAHFTSDFIWFHRPLSDYWKAFKACGFDIDDFEEPRVSESRHHLAEDDRRLRNSMWRPYSVAFKLKKASDLQSTDSEGKKDE